MSTTHSLEGIDATQAALLDEVVILVDNNDVALGFETKKNSHLMENIDKGMLHRAFSCFLFNSNGELLLQQRARSKVTFPGNWTNTCCSHPLNIPEEVIEDQQIGVRKAVIRKLNHELGIPLDSIKPEDLFFLTKIHYKSASGEGIWGEHEVDYIFFVQKDVHLKVNPNEVMDCKYIKNYSELTTFLKSASMVSQITPWFQLIVNSFLEKWWTNLGNLSSVAQPDVIHHMA